MTRRVCFLRIPAAASESGFVGGIERLVAFQAAELQRRGWRVQVLCGGASSTAALLVRFFTERGLESERLRGTGLLSAAAHTAMYVQRRAVTCLVAEGKTEAIVAAAALLCDRRVALFQRHHTVGAPKGLRRILNALCEASVMQRIDGHLVISQLLARTLPAMHRLRVPILYVPNGVSQPEEAALLSTGHAPVAPRVAMVARMDGKKGHDCALAALARLSVRECPAPSRWWGAW